MRITTQEDQRTMHDIVIAPAILEKTQRVAKELVKEEAKLVILSGSAARGRENPKDLDIAAVFPTQNKLLVESYRKNLVARLEQEVAYKVDLIDYNEGLVNDLIEKYNKKPTNVCFGLNYMCMDNVRDQWVGWPLAWIFGEEARERLRPYGCFQDQFKVLAGQAYLEVLKRKIKRDNT